MFLARPHAPAPAFRFAGRMTALDYAIQCLQVLFYVHLRLAVA